MNDQDLTQMPAIDEDQDDAEIEIGGWSVFWALLLGVGFVVHMAFFGIGDGPRTGLYWRLRFIFYLVGGVAITGMALAVLTRMKKPRE
jgi:hypothetical protein